MDENDPLLDDENPDSEYNRLLRIAAWAKANGLLGPDGEPRKILGKPRYTLDGAIIMDKAEVFYVHSHWRDETAIVCTRAVIDVTEDCDLSRCWSDASLVVPSLNLTLESQRKGREAAERAAKERSDG